MQFEVLMVMDAEEVALKNGLREAYERSNSQRRKNLFEHERDQYISDRKAKRRMKRLESGIEKEVELIRPYVEAMTKEADYEKVFVREAYFTDFDDNSVGGNNLLTGTITLTNNLLKDGNRHNTYRALAHELQHAAPRSAARGDTVIDLLALETCARIGTEKKRPEYLASVYDALAQYSNAYYLKLAGRTPEGLTQEEAETYRIKPYEALKGLAKSGSTTLTHTDGRNYDLSNLVRLWKNVKV